jgi:hypothetical protein
MKPTNLLIIGGAVVLGGIYLSNKGKKEKALNDARLLALANAKTPPTTNSSLVQESNFYTSSEATKKALEVVTKWVSLLDAIPKEALTEENKKISNLKIRIEREKQSKIDYDKAFAEAKLKKRFQFTFQDNTYFTKNEEDIRNGTFRGTTFIPNSNTVRFDNPYKGTITNYASAILNNLFFGSKFVNLADYVKNVKNISFSNIYDFLKVKFTELPKAEVDRLVILLPKLLIMGGADDFIYLQTEYEKNPFTMEEKLFLKDINLEGLGSSKKEDRKTANVLNQ